jgi:hypothetical protein
MQKRRLWIHREGDDIRISLEEPLEQERAYINAFLGEAPDQLEVLPELGLVYSRTTDVFYPIYARRQNPVLA